MGQLVSDLYQVDDLQWMSRSDALPVRYAWVDFKVNGQENRLYFDRFKEEFAIEAHDSLQSFKARLQDWNQNKEKLRVICAAALPDEGYELIQKSSKVDRAILFCGNKVRANNLIRDYPKIRKACFGYTDVSKTVQAWKLDSQTSVLFYDLQEVEAFNRYNVNIRALTDSSISLKEAKEHFKKYFEKFLKKADLLTFNAINEEYTKLRPTQDALLRASTNKEALLKFIMDCLLKSNLILDEVNMLLRSTDNPRKLAYLRLVISDLFAAIRQSYKETKFTENTYAAVVELNDEERRRIRESSNKYIVFTHFLKASTVEPSEQAKISDTEIIFEIKVPNKFAGIGKCNGYLLVGNRAYFNLGNYMRVISVSEDGKRVRVALVELPVQCDLEWRKKDQCLALNQRWLNAQQEKYEGQCYSLLLHDEKMAFNFIDSKITAGSKEKQYKEDINFRWVLSRQKWKIRTGRPIQEIQPYLQALTQGPDHHKIIAILTLCELYWNRKNDTMFKATMRRLGLFKEPMLKSDERTQIFRIYDQFLSMGSKFDREVVIEQLKKKELDLVRNPNYLTSDAYHLLINIRIACLNQMNRYEEELQLIDKMILIYSVCEGTTSPEFVKLNQLKISVVARKDEELNQREMARKTQLATSAVSIEQLKMPTFNEALPIDASKLDFSLFN